MFFVAAAIFLEGETEKDTVSIKAIPRGSTWTKAFDDEVFLQSAWNGSLEIHQKRDSGELVSSIPDLRDYNAEDYLLWSLITSSTVS